MDQTFNFDNIPNELKAVNNWVCWSGDKLPKNPCTGGNAQSNNPATWSNYDTAIKAIEKYSMSGIGFMFSEPYFGVDLDKCIDNLDFIDEFVDTLESYTEYSKSGNGIHIICRGKLPDGARRKGNVEMYSIGRFFIMTGNFYKELKEINECSETVKILHSKYLAGSNKSIINLEYEKLNLSDDEIIDRARLSKNGAYFEALYRGSWQGVYSSQSEADLAFCNMLAFWTQRDFQQMDRIFRSSGLMRKKWNENRGGVTYAQKTIEKAIIGCSECYNKSMFGKEGEIVATGKTTKNPQTHKEYEMSDTGNGLRFAEKYKDIIRYNYTTGTWFYWNGKRWCEDDTGEIKRLADLVIKDIKKQAFTFADDEKKQELYLKWAMRTASSKTKENMVKEAQHIDAIAIRNSQFDIQDDTLNCENGIVNLKNGELTAHNSTMMMSKISYSAYDNKSKKKPEKWLSFLDDITAGDKELQLYLQKAVGYSLSGSIKEQCLFFCYGNGNNGKSTFLDVISDLAGTYSMNMQAESIMVKKNTGAVNTDIARLKGARFVTVAEPEENVRLNESLVKQMTGGDKITARFLYGKEFEYKPEFKLWIGTNHKPIIRGTDEGIWRRVVLIPFLVKIPMEKVDKNLSYKLRKELPLIMKWAVDGCIMWQKNGLAKPHCIQQATDEYRSAMDVLSKFIVDCIEQGSEKDGLKASVLYSIYQKWAAETNEYELSNTKFGKEFLNKFPNKEKKRDGLYYRGCVLSEYGISFMEDKGNTPFGKAERYSYLTY